jgi:hypothetical protein
MGATPRRVWGRRAIGLRESARAARGPARRGAQQVSAPADAFSASRCQFEGLTSFLESEECLAVEHAELESAIETRERELLRQMVQDHLDLRALREVRLSAVVDGDGVGRTRVEAGHARSLETVFGEVQVRRLAYRAEDRGNLHPADGALNLPRERHSNRR